MFTSLWHSRHLGYDLQGSPVRSPSAALVENWCLGFFCLLRLFDVFVTLFSTHTWKALPCQSFQNRATYKEMTDCSIRLGYDCHSKQSESKTRLQDVQCLGLLNVKLPIFSVQVVVCCIRLWGLVSLGLDVLLPMSRNQTLTHTNG